MWKLKLLPLGVFLLGSGRRKIHLMFLAFSSPATDLKFEPLVAAVAVAAELSHVQAAVSLTSPKQLQKSSHRKSLFPFGWSETSFWLSVFQTIARRMEHRALHVKKKKRNQTWNILSMSIWLPDSVSRQQNSDRPTENEALTDLSDRTSDRMPSVLHQ